ncbi:MAG: type II toxin-antitoxin system HigB family toxin [Gammaproteobacteria bacterium]|nr:type II toxin-antitoxin system HigB family toxin [Gammaproteobacteria bacterium]
MHVIAWKALKSFGERHPDAAGPLRQWVKLVENGRFTSFADLRRTFGSIDKVRELRVFNIGGNKYRLVAYVRFDWQRCYIKHVLTHDEYDEGDWKS